jgi:bifunctional oligoribonuclease and PAP phosphatase NrnA
MEVKLTASFKTSRKKKTEILKKIADLLRREKRFLIASHENPEGDAIGSVLALGLALREMGKTVVMLNQDLVPDILLFLPQAGEIIHQAPKNERFDVALTLDCGDRKRLGEEFNKLDQIGTLINIDHHVSNTRFGDINLVDPQASSTAEMVYELLREIPLKITPAIAENIYAGILTDTGSFHYSNTTAKTFAVARTCILSGVNPSNVAENIYETQPLARLRLLPLVLGTLEIEEDGRVSSVVVTREMLAKTEATPALTEDFINYPRSVKGTEVAMLFREINPQKYRVSFRSRGKVDVSRISQMFQGGGHPNAAGCTIDGTLRDVKGKVLAQVRAAL